MSTLVHIIGAIALLFIIVLVGDHLVARLRESIMHRRRNRMARKYGFVEWQPKDRS